MTTYYKIAYPDKVDHLPESNCWFVPILNDRGPLKLHMIHTLGNITDLI